MESLGFPLGVGETIPYSGIFSRIPPDGIPGAGGRGGGEDNLHWCQGNWKSAEAIDPPLRTIWPLNSMSLTGVPQVRH